ncbi:MAG: hypothetical protein J2P36_31345, partial [Ktedonobacteraceae bacterium]|nr:hypothetical protein [Ktedonobacteraceae bacterium]
MEETPATKPSLQQIWDDSAEYFAHVTDRLGKPIEPEIMETVVALNVLGIPTTMSCGGHLDEHRGFVAPWVDIWWSNAAVEHLKGETGQKRQQAETLDQELARLRQASVLQEDLRALQQKRYDAYQEMHALRRQVRLLQCPTRQKLAYYLAQFYQSRVVPFDQRLILNVSTAGFGHTRLLSQGAGDLYLDAAS